MQQWPPTPPSSMPPTPSNSPEPQTPSYMREIKLTINLTSPVFDGLTEYLTARAATQNPSIGRTAAPQDDVTVTLQIALTLSGTRWSGTLQALSPPVPLVPPPPPPASETQQFRHGGPIPNATHPSHRGRPTQTSTGGSSASLYGSMPLQTPYSSAPLTTPRPAPMASRPAPERQRNQKCPWCHRALTHACSDRCHTQNTPCNHTQSAPCRSRSRTPSSSSSGKSVRFQHPLPSLRPSSQPRAAHRRH